MRHSISLRRRTVWCWLYLASFASTYLIRLVHFPIPLSLMNYATCLVIFYINSHLFIGLATRTIGRIDNHTNNNMHVNYTPIKGHRINFTNKNMLYVTNELSY